MRAWRRSYVTAGDSYIYGRLIRGLGIVLAEETGGEGEEYLLLVRFRKDSTGT